MTLPRFIVLDLDGPILDGVGRHYAVYRDILQENGHHPLARDEYWELKKNLVDRRMLLARSDAEGLYDQFLATWLERIEQKHYLALDTLQPGVVKVLEQWRTRGVRLLLATMRNNAEHLNWQLNALGLRRHFDEVVVVQEGTAAAEKVGRSKAGRVRDVLGAFDSRDVVWVGDTEADMRAAQELGVTSCAVVCGLRNEAFLRSLAPDYIVRDVPELAVKLR